MNVLVVDDEAGIREHLVSMLQGVDGLTARQAAGGEEALRILDGEPVELVLTDIRMPGVDGIELIRQCRLKFPDVWCIVLSNYAEFELARQAIALGARNYLLKATITREQLQDEIRRAAAQLEKEKRRGPDFDAGDRLLLQQSLFHERLHGHIQRTELLRRAERLGAPFFLQPLDASSMFAILEIGRMDRWAADKFRGQTDLAVYALINVARETIQRWHPGNELFHLGDNRFVVLDLEERDEARHRRKMEEVGEALAKYLSVEASLLVGGSFAGLDGLFERVAATRPLWDLFFYENGACVIEMRQVEAPAADLDLFTFFESVEGAGARVLQSSLPGLVETYFELLRHLRRPASSVREDVRTLIRFIEKKGYLVPETLRSEVERRQATRLADYKQLFEGWLGELARSGGKQRDEIARALSFIHERYNTRITLEDVCAAVNLSRSHLSKLFKDQQGVSVIEYLEAYRLKQARLLVRTTKRPLADIAEAVGVGDVFYFSKLYKKRFGVNPSKDRQG